MTKTTAIKSGSRKIETKDATEAAFSGSASTADFQNNCSAVSKIMAANRPITTLSGILRGNLITSGIIRPGLPITRLKLFSGYCCDLQATAQRLQPGPSPFDLGLFFASATPIETTIVITEL